MKMTNLEKIYKEWRKQMEQFIAEGLRGSIDCGEEMVRKDFTEFAGLEEEITFEEMFELEKEYEYEDDYWEK